MIYASVCLILYIILSRLIIIKGMNSTNSGLQIYKFELWSYLEFLKSIQIYFKFSVSWGKECKTENLFIGNRIVDFLP